MGRTQAERESAAAWLKRDRESRRNLDFWNQHYLELSKQHRDKWLLIYDGCTVRGVRRPAGNVGRARVADALAA